MFWAHEPNRPVAGPNLRSTMPTPIPASCSVECLKGATRAQCVAAMHGQLPHLQAVCPLAPDADEESPGRALHLLPHSHALLFRLSLALQRLRARAGARPPWPAGQACRRRVPAAPSSLESYRVRQHLPCRAPPLRLPFFGHRSRRSIVTAGAAAGAPPARAAGRPQAASGRARKPKGCARAHGPSPPLPPPATRLLRPVNSELLRSSFKNREQGPCLKIRENGRF